MIQLTFYLEPVGKARVRTTIKDGKAWVYTPDKTAYAEEFIKASVISWANKKGVKSFPIFERGLPLRMTTTFVRSRPKSIPKKVEMPVTKPDLDNYIKLVKDSIRGIIYYDDSQVVGESSEKEYVTADSIPRIELTVWEANEKDMPVKERRDKNARK